MKEGCLVSILMAFVLVLAVVLIFTSCTPSGVAFVNNWQHAIRKVDDATRYETRKEVEDTCRATIVSYESDKLMWEQYKDSEDEEQRSWAESAKIRANKAAVTYNEYFLKNSYVFEGNVPSDIRYELEILK